MWTRRQALAAAAALLAAPPVVRAAGGPTRLVVVLVDGGWDATFALDPKLGSPHVASPVAVAGEEQVRTSAGIPVQVNDTTRPSVSTFFERHAARSVVVNGLWLGGIAHRPNKVRLLTGTADEGAPDLVTAAGVALGAGTPLGAVDLSGIGFAGRSGDAQARVGNVGQLRTLVILPPATPRSTRRRWRSIPRPTTRSRPTSGLGGPRPELPPGARLRGCAPGSGGRALGVAREPDRPVRVGDRGPAEPSDGPAGRRICGFGPARDRPRLGYPHRQRPPGAVPRGAVRRVARPDGPPGVDRCD